MRYRVLGRTGLEVSEIGFGAWGIGGGWGARDDREALAAIDRALSLGVNFFDTALAYGDGHSERLIARGLREAGRGAVVATKVPPKNREWPARHDLPVQEVFPADWIVRCTEKSLKNLGLDCIDLQQLHVWSPRWVQETEWLEGLRRLQEAGKIRFVGVSINDHEPDTALDLVRTGWIDTLQVIYNIFDQSPADRLFPLAMEYQIGILARCPLDEGALTGTLREDARFDPDDWRSEYFAGDRLRETVRRVEALRFLESDGRQSLAQAAIRFCLSHPAVSTVIPGMRRVRHVEENCQVSDGACFGPAEMERLSAHRWDKNFYV